MTNIILTVLLTAAPVAAQEFSFDPAAMSAILSGAQVLKVKHDGRPAPPMISDYEARHIDFRLRSNGKGREDGVIFVNKSIEFLYKEMHLATLHLNSDPRGWADAERTLKSFQSLRDDAVNQKRRIVINYDAIERQNKAGSWEMPRNPKECELFDEVIRLGILHAGK